MFPFDIPKTYSDMLNKIGICTFGVAFICTIVAGKYNDRIDASLHFAQGVKVNLGLVQLDGLPFGYLLLPAAVAFVARFLRLHDRVSDLLRIRAAYDVEYILGPLANGVGVNADSSFRKILTAHRKSLMYDVFYPYAGYAKPQIDENIVLLTLDSLTWYWVSVEAFVLVLLTAVILVFAKALIVAALLICVSAVLVLTAYALYQACTRNTAAEVREILKDPNRRDAIRGRFDALYS